MKRFDRGCFSRALLALCLALPIVRAPRSAAQQPAQNPVPRQYYELDYMRVAPGKDNDYVRLEREVWKPFHMQRIKDKRLVSWELYEVRYTADTHRDYDYVTVNVYDSFAALEDTTFEAQFRRVHAGKDPTRLLEQTSAARQVARAEVWRLVDQTAPRAGPPPRSRYIVVDYMRSKPNVDYVAMERELWKPVHQDRVRSGSLDRWTLWELVLPGGASYPYDYATVNDLSKLSLLQDAYTEDLFRRVHPKIALNDIANRTTAARDLTRHELWVLVDATP
jgi:hypothetical protein